MKPKLVLSTVICLLFTFSCISQSFISKFDALEGLWKIENKNTYESWEKEGVKNFIGKSYKLKEGQKNITETLSITESDGEVMYKATVVNQNQGNTISFSLNTTNKDCFSFENLEHDFPKKIQYKIVTKNKLLVNVFGKNNQGFSYYLIRQ